MFDIKKYLRYSKSDLNELPYSDLVEIAFTYIDAFKVSQCNRMEYNQNLINKLETLTKQVDELQKQLKDAQQYFSKYNTLVNTKLTFKQRLLGKIMK